MLWSLSLSFDFHDTHTHTKKNMIGTSKMLSDDGDEEEDAAV